MQIPDLNEYFSGLRKLLANRLINLIVVVLFFIFIYNIVYQIGIFFSVDQNILDTYLVWIAVIMILVAVLPVNKSVLTPS
jgi:hypothetical protein